MWEPTPGEVRSLLQKRVSFKLQVHDGALGTGIPLFDRSDSEIRSDMELLAGRCDTRNVGARGLVGRKPSQRRK